LLSKNYQLKHKYVNYNYKFHLTMTSHWRCFRQLIPCFLSISIGMLHILLSQMCWCHFNELALKLQIRTANLVRLYSNVSLIAPLKCCHVFSKASRCGNINYKPWGSLFIGIPGSPTYTALQKYCCFHEFHTFQAYNTTRQKVPLTTISC